MAALAPSVHVGLPAEEDVIELGRVEASLVFKDQPRHSVLHLPIYLLVLTLQISPLSSISICVNSPLVHDLLNLKFVGFASILLHLDCLSHRHHIHVSTCLAPSNHGLAQRIP